MKMIGGIRPAPLYAVLASAGFYDLERKKQNLIPSIFPSSMGRYIDSNNNKDIVAYRQDREPRSNSNNVINC